MSLLSRLFGTAESSRDSDAEQLGYVRVVNVAGGMNAWFSAGLPVSR